MKDVEEVHPAEAKQHELFFFVEEKERFKMSDLLEAQADLQGHGLCSSLYKVKLKNNNTIFAVKRLKQSPLSFDEYCTLMKQGHGLCSCLFTCSSRSDHDRHTQRLIKNRESAARSRERKEAHTAQLEDEVQKLEAENAELKKQQQLLACSTT